MRSHMFTLLCMMCLPLAALADEKPSIHLTGNRSVDFFGPLQSLPAAGRPGFLLQEGLMQPTGVEGRKSPWLAGFMSLAVPGSGEVYTGNYLKGALFFAADVAAWTVSIVYNKKGDNQTSDFQAFANAHYNPVQYVNWTLDNLAAISPPLGGDASQYANAIYGSGAPRVDPNTCGPPFRCINWAELNAMESAIGDNLPPGGNAYTHDLPYYGVQQYYELIGKYAQFSRGWDDADLNDVTIPVQSKSPRMVAYSIMRAQANYSYDVASTFVSVAVINHILSAVDAFWSATRFNETLHAELEMRMQQTPYGIVPLTEARFRYDF